MEENSFFLAAIAELYDRQPLALHSLRRNNPEGKRLYRVDFTEGPSWTMRAYQPGYGNSDLCQWLSSSSPLFEWLQTQALILHYVAHQGYPAPRLVPSRTGALVGTYDDWHILITTFVDGNARDTQPEKMVALGASLGHLHTLPLPEQPANSWWSIMGLHDGLHRLTSSAHAVPEEGQALYTTSLQTFTYFLQRVYLPQTLIHGDCWAENGIQTQKEQGILIDWECAGLGVAVLDIGSLLLHCHFDQLDLLEHQAYPQYQPDPQRITAVVNGYYRQRHLSAEELDALLEAIRFSIAWRGAWFFFFLAKNGPNEWLQGALRRWQRWYAISEEIAHISHAAIEQTG